MLKFVMVFEFWAGNGLPVFEKLSGTGILLLVVQLISAPTVWMPRSSRYTTLSTILLRVGFGVCNVAVYLAAQLSLNTHMSL